jgi:hypothetical protein
MNTVDINASRAIDGFAGGTYNPSDEIILNERFTADASSIGANSTAVTAVGNGNLSGVNATGGDASGAGITTLGGAPNGKGIDATGDGTAAGVDTIGGDSSGPGVLADGGAPNGGGVLAQGAGTGTGVAGTGGLTSGIGVVGTGGAPDGHGIKGVGTGNGIGVQGESTGTGQAIKATAVGGKGLYATSSNNAAIHGEATGAWQGIIAEGKAAAPTKGALQVVLQNALPSGPSAGDISHLTEELFAYIDGTWRMMTPVKAWGLIETDGATGITLVDSYNVSSVSIISNIQVRAFFSDDMKDQDSYVGAGNFVAAGDHICNITPQSATPSTYVNIGGYQGGVGAVNFNTSALTFSFIIVGTLD